MSDKYNKGLENFRTLFGDAHTERELEQVTDFDRDFHRVLMEYCFDEVWSGKGLSWKQKSLNNLCMLAVMNRPAQFETHFRGALRNGCTLDELRDTLIQITVYAGIPVGAEAFRIAKKVLKEEGIIQ